tara:strand:- start:4678 stop:5091 length:414 start_codon:yes stop_codon:yes gene_type:complete
MKFLETTEICIISIYLILLILIYRMCLQWFDIELYNDPLIVKLHPDLPFDKWQLSHFVAYMIAASFYPHYKYFLFFVGIIWEIIEIILGKIFITDIDTINKIDKINQWWYGSPYDIIANGLGILVGVYLLNPIYKYF